MLNMICYFHMLKLVYPPDRRRDVLQLRDLKSTEGGKNLEEGRCAFGAETPRGLHVANYLDRQL